MTYCRLIELGLIYCYIGLLRWLHQFHHPEVELEELEMQEVEQYPCRHHCHCYWGWQDRFDQQVPKDPQVPHLLGLLC